MSKISKLEEQTVRLDQETINKADLYKNRSIYKAFTCSADKNRRVKARIIGLDRRGIFTNTE